MKIVNEVREHVARLLTSPVEELGRGARWASRYLRMSRYCVGRMVADNVMAMSAALSYRTIFTLVPTIILAFLLLKSLGVVEDNRRVLRDFLEQSGMSQITYVERSEAPPGGPAPEAGAGSKITVAEKIEAIIDHFESQVTVGRVGPVGVALLIWTAITLLTTMERSLNRIFEAPRARSLGRRILIYWSALTLGPLMLAATVNVGGRATSYVQGMPLVSILLWVIGWAGPLVAGVLLLAGCYSLMPNTQVRFRVALQGAIVAGPLWLLVRWGFALYVDHVGSKSLYGAMGLVPLFLLWLNLSWLIFLFGAEVAHGFANAGRLTAGGRADAAVLTAWHLLAAALAVARGQWRGQGPVPAGEVAARLGLPDVAADRLLARLTETGVLCRVAGDGPPQCVLAAPAERIPVSRLLRMDDAAGAGADTGITAAVARVRQRCEAGVETLTLADLVPE